MQDTVPGAGGIAVSQTDQLWAHRGLQPSEMAGHTNHRMTTRTYSWANAQLKDFFKVERKSQSHRSVFSLTMRELQGDGMGAHLFPTLIPLFIY